MDPRVTLRFDKDFSIVTWRELFQTAGYNESWSEENGRAALEYAYLVVTAWIEESMVGTLTVWSDGINFGWIDDVVVDPAHQHQGVGSLLVTAAVERLRPGIKAIQVFPIPGAEPFYERLGFVVQSGATVMDLPPLVDM